MVTSEVGQVSCFRLLKSQQVLVLGGCQCRLDQSLIGVQCPFSIALEGVNPEVGPDILIVKERVVWEGHFAPSHLSTRISSLCSIRFVANLNPHQTILRGARVRQFISDLVPQ